MVKRFIQIILFLLLALLLFFTYLSLYGISTDKFNNLISEKVSEKNKNLDVNLNNIDQLPENAQEMLEGIDFSRYGDKVKPSGVVMYLAAKTIVNTVNQTDAFPNFPALAREILQHNFIQIFARPKGGTLGFDVLWPNREMATGKVELYYKGSANEPQKQRLSFSVS